MRRISLGIAMLLAATLGLVAVPAANAVAPTAFVQLDPKIVETGARTDPEAASSAGARGFVKLDGDSGQSYTVYLRWRLVNSGATWDLLDTKVMNTGSMWMFTGWAGYEYKAVIEIPGSNWHSATEQYTWVDLFTEEFSSVTLDTAKWGVRRTDDWPEEYSVNTLDALTLTGSVARMEVEEDPAYNDCPAGAGQDCHVLITNLGSAHGSTPFRVDLNDGDPIWMAARVRTQEGRGAHGAFWLQSGYCGTCAEVDIAEWFGVGSNEKLWHNLYYGTGPDAEDAGCIPYDCQRETTPLSYLPSGEDWWDDWHIFALKWDGAFDTYRVYIDGVWRYDLDEHFGTAAAEVILSNHVKDWENQYIDWPDFTLAKGTADTDYAFEVDWVKVWRP